MCRVENHLKKNDFDVLVATNNLEGLLKSYPLRESGALTQIAREVGLSRVKYEAAVQKLLHEDDGAVAYVRGLFGTMVSEIDSV